MGARFTVYLPEDLRDRARAAGLNMSELLRLEVIKRLKAGADDEGTPAPAPSSS